MEADLRLILYFQRTAQITVHDCKFLNANIHLHKFLETSLVNVLYSINQNATFASGLTDEHVPCEGHLCLRRTVLQCSRTLHKLYEAIVNAVLYKELLTWRDSACGNYGKSIVRYCMNIDRLDKLLFSTNMMC